MSFPDQPTLTGPTLHLRPLQRDDAAALGDAASDPGIWAGHPSSDRHKAEVFAPYFEMLLNAGGTLIVAERSSGKVIGCSRYYPTPEAPGAYGIGFTFLTRAFWGGTTNREMKTLMLDHAFDHMDQVWLHVDPTNIRSQKATLKIGARFVEEAARDIGDKTGIWRCYVVERDVWRARQS
ncbi:GNAT family N-acetyltransferase [uncultured Tateyamaria sp.]|uniref:GNAT family N-acetyltransferase n=1 Tax=uncultured Tateyamaria sp. TaxID=455651 RepID=UPI002639C544|nr:GNAT family N-acetyltransferase [uncultured Tateyamaria sp.]